MANQGTLSESWEGSQFNSKASEKLEEEIIKCGRNSDSAGIIALLYGYDSRKLIRDAIRRRPNLILFGMLKAFGYSARDGRQDFDRDDPEAACRFLIGLIMCDFQNGLEVCDHTKKILDLAFEGVHPSDWEQKMPKGYSLNLS